MIGVCVNPSEKVVAAEFFELFKTPWEFYRSGQQYDVLLCTTNEEFDAGAAELVVLYGDRKLPFDAEEKIEIASRSRERVLSYKESRIPVYGGCVTFRNEDGCLLLDEQLQQAAMYRRGPHRRALVRIGYSLFDEVAVLLADGQPAEFAEVPTLDLHIALLRELIIANGLSLVEIPPAPYGHPFIACLTHDVDHPSIREHKWDHTMLGFLSRAVFDSLGKLLRGRIRSCDLIANWVAALKLPLVHMGIARDFWSSFVDDYLEAETGLRSTYFVIPFKGRAGKTLNGTAPGFRAAGYGIADLAEPITKMAAAGCEVALHGVDAWLDSTRGREEFAEVRRMTGSAEIGARMHWLYYDPQQSPLRLEEAGAAYDSTVGYRETVGYRAGTTQAYKPLQATRLLEVPMHGMDTALFYPDYLGLSSREATARLCRLADTAVRFGGCFTINWHDRSLAPERLWRSSYQDLIEELKGRRAWFATVGQASAWFRKRRAVVFERNGAEIDVACRVAADAPNDLPGLCLRVYKPRAVDGAGIAVAGGYIDGLLDENVEAVCLDTTS